MPRPPRLPAKIFRSVMSTMTARPLPVSGYCGSERAMPSRSESGVLGGVGGRASARRRRKERISLLRTSSYGGDADAAAILPPGAPESLFFRSVFSSPTEASAIRHSRRTKDIYGGVDPRSLPAYPLVEAAHYLGLNASTLGSWFREGALLLPDGDSDQMSFWNLVEAFVLKGLREEHRMSLQRIRVAVDELRRQYPKLTHPLAQLDLAVLNRDLYADRDGLLVDASRGGQLGIRGVLEG